jgi:hypothetical protein
MYPGGVSHYYDVRFLPLRGALRKRGVTSTRIICALNRING